jgi:hypothetical protein
VSEYTVGLMKYIAAHAAGFGSLAGAIVMLFQGNMAGAFTLFMTALAGFGLAVKPQSQFNLSLNAPSVPTLMDAAKKQAGSFTQSAPPGKEDKRVN